MLARVHMHQEVELLKWMLLLALAGALTLVFATGTVGAAELTSTAQEPALLPGNIAELAAPMDLGEKPQPLAASDVAMQVWQAIDAQHHEDFERAIALWDAIQMPCETEVWKHVAMGQAYLATDDMENAIAALARAERLEPENAVVHYFVGILRLQQAYVADEWNDAEGRPATVLVSHSPHAVVPNTQSMYRMQAMLELEEAVRLAPQVHLYQSLVPDAWPTTAAMPPAVHDVLLASRADNFAAKAHNMLGDLYLGRGALQQAERHMDAAVQGGLSVVYGYGELAEAYEEAGLHSDAMRVYLKAAQGEPGKVAPLKKAWENLRDSML